MNNISSIVDNVIKKHIGDDMPELKYNISTNLEFRLLFPIDMSKPYREAKKTFIRHYLNDLLTLSLGNISLAARKAQMHRRHLHRIINELDIDAESHRRDLVKPSEYIKENIHNILEETLSALADENEKVRSVYMNLNDISEVIAKNMDSTVTFDDAVDLFEKEFLGKALKENHYDISKTANTLDISERTLYRKISKLNIATA